MCVMYGLLASCYAVCRFGEHELGKPLRDDEFQQVLADEYGDMKITEKQLVEDAAQEELQLQQQQHEEEAVVKQAPLRRLQPSLTPAGNGTIGSSSGGPSRPLAAGVAGSAAALGAAGRGDALASRIMPQGAAATTGLVSRWRLHVMHS